MDSIHVDNSFRDKTTNEAAGRCKVCNHSFSIRGFVLKLRQREPRLCYPFGLKGSSDLWKELPSMVVPKAKYWRCPVCVPENEWDVLKDLFGMSNKVAQKPDEATDAAVPLVGLSSKVTNTAVGFRITEVSASTDSKDNRNCSPTTNVCADRKGKGKEKAYIEDDLPSHTGFLNVFLKNSSSQGIQVQIADDIKASSFDGKDCQTEKGREISRALSEDNRVEALIHGVTTDMPGFVSRLCSQSHQVNLPDLNECSGGPLYEYNKENIVTDNNVSNLSEDDDDYLGAERRKKPKVRLLSELLGLRETQVPAKARKRNPSFAGSLDENIKRKRVESQDEVSKFMEIKGSNIGTNKFVGTFERSESEAGNGSDSDNVSSEKISDALAKKHSKSKDLLLEKRNKKIKVAHGESSSMSRQQVKPKSIHGNGKSFDLLQKHDVSAQSNERNLVLTKRRGKVLRARKDAVSLVPCKSRMPQECGTTQNDKEAEQNATENVKNALGSAHHIPNSYESKENDQLCIPIRKGGFYAPSSQAEPMLSSRKHKQNKDIEETNIAFRTTAAGISSAADKSDENCERSNDPKTNPKEKKAGVEAEGLGPLSQQIPLQVPNSVVNHEALTNEVRGRVQDIDINTIPTDDKTNEQGLGDDIPMDIVELMAKNQYERHLDDTKDKHNFPASPVLTGTFIRQDGICGSYGQQTQNFSQSHFLSMQKPLSLDNRNSVVNASWGHLSDSSSNPLGARGLPRVNPVSTGFLFPSQIQEHISPYFSRGLAPSNWNENNHMAGQQRLTPSFLNTTDTYTKFRACALRQSATEASQVWPSVMASHMPLGITNPRMISPTSNVLNREKIHHQSPGSMFSFSSAATHIGKQQTLNFSNAYNSGHSESFAGSVDANDDSIPAMQLLGLVQGNEKLQNTDLSLGQKTSGLNNSRQPFIKTTGRPPAMLDNYHNPYYPTTLPTSQPFTPSYHRNGTNIGRTGASFIGAIPLTSRGQRNMEGSYFAPPGGESQPLRQQMAPSLDKGKGVVCKPSSVDQSKGIASMALPLDNRKGIASMALPLDKRKGIASMALPLDKSKGTASVSTLSFANAFPMMRDCTQVQPRPGVRRDRKKFFPACDKRLCQLNQNPSEFTDLQLAQSFMYGASELRPRGSAHGRTPQPKGGAKKPESSGNKPVPSGTGRVKPPKEGP